MDEYARRQAQFGWGGSLELLAYMLCEKRDVWIWVPDPQRGAVGSTGALQFWCGIKKTGILSGPLFLAILAGSASFLSPREATKEKSTGILAANCAASSRRINDAVPTGNLRDTSASECHALIRRVSRPHKASVAS